MHVDHPVQAALIYALHLFQSHSAPNPDSLRWKSPYVTATPISHSLLWSTTPPRQWHNPLSAWMEQHWPRSTFHTLTSSIPVGLCPQFYRGCQPWPTSNWRRYCKGQWRGVAKVKRSFPAGNTTSATSMGLCQKAMPKLTSNHTQIAHSHLGMRHFKHVILWTIAGLFVWLFPVTNYNAPCLLTISCLQNFSRSSTCTYKDHKASLRTYNHVFLVLQMFSAHTHV